VLLVVLLKRSLVQTDDLRVFSTCWAMDFDPRIPPALFVLLRDSVSVLETPVPLVKLRDFLVENATSQVVGYSEE
jgi:hypothetical protein